MKDEKVPAGVGKAEWTRHCQKLKPHLSATVGDCFAWHFLPPFPRTKGAELLKAGEACVLGPAEKGCRE